MTKHLYIKTYGCQMNVYDSDRMADILSPLGYALSETPEGADMVILNTCHIREKAEEKVYSDLGRIKPYKILKPDMLIAVAGCVGQAEGAEIMRRAPYVDIVLGPQTYHRLPEMIARATRSRESEKTVGRGILDIDFPVDSKFDNLPDATQGVGVAAFLSIQEGCDKFCTFCVVPYTRGAEYSRPVDAVLEDARKLVERGSKEITFLGQNVSAYHGESASGEWTLARLVKELADIKGLERIRYITSHPREIGEDLIEAHGTIPELMPYLHLPIQSGSDRILEAMNRKHTSNHYRDVIADLRRARPDIALSSDFIVGFPGETDQDFEDTLQLVRDIGYAQAYSFKYSPRHGTPGAVMDRQVDEAVKVERLARLQALLNEQQWAFNVASVGKTMPVLIEKKGRTEGQFVGRSPYMQSVLVEGTPRLIGQIVDVHITEGSPNSLRGTIVTDEIVLKRAS